MLVLTKKHDNSEFNSIEFDGFRNNSGLNSFILTSKQWIEKTSAIGIFSQSGRYGGTFAHKDIAIEFASWISVKFKLFLIKEFQRLKIKESKEENIEWDLKRDLVKINYKIHTSAIKQHLIPKELNAHQINKIYANEADILNMALFGKTAKDWKKQKLMKNNNKNMRDYASLSQLICLSNLESLNAYFIDNKMSQSKRLKELNFVAISQMKILTIDDGKKLDK